MTRNLEILISMPNDQSSLRVAHAEAIMNVLELEVHRWKELWFYSEIGVLGFPRDLSKANSLTKLSISAGIIDEDAIKLIGPTLHNVPGALRALNLDGVDFDGLYLFGRRYPMHLDHLERLTLQYDGWIQGILNILSDVQNSLISADIHVEGQWSHSTEYHSLASYNPHISLTTLRYLKLWIYDANLDLFDYLEMNSLMVVDLSVNWTTIPEYARSIAPLIGFIINRSPSLRTCTMKFNGLPTDWGTMAFRSPAIMRLRTYKFYNVALGSVTREEIAKSAPFSIITRIRFIAEDIPLRFTIGWDEADN